MAFDLTAWAIDPDSSRGLFYAAVGVSTPFSTRMLGFATLTSALKEIAEESAPDIVFVAEAAGSREEVIALTRALREIARTPGQTSIACVLTIPQPDERAGAGFGVDAVLALPVDAHVLLGMVESHYANMLDERSRDPQKAARAHALEAIETMMEHIRTSAGRSWLRDRVLEVLGILAGYLHIGVLDVRATRSVMSRLSAVMPSARQKLAELRQRMRSVPTNPLTHEAAGRRRTNSHTSKP